MYMKRRLEEIEEKYEKPKPVEFDYEKELSIDKFNLDFECQDQPRRFFKWSEMWAEATMERDKAEQNLKVIKAKAHVAIRTNPEQFGLDKVTDITVGLALEAHPDVVEASNVLIDAKYKVNILLGAKEAFQDRRSRLSDMVQLFISGYWSEVKLPKGSAEEITKAEGILQRQHLQGRLKK